MQFILLIYQIFLILLRQLYNKLTPSLLRRSGFGWQAFHRFRHHPQLPAMRFHYIITQTQPQSRSLSGLVVKKG
jgi:hypothetical protein